MREAEIQSAILDYLGACGFLHWRVCLGAVMGGGGKFFRKNPMRGHPDIAGVLRPSGRYFAIEVKRPTRARWSPEQREWRDRLTAAGVLYLVASSVEDVRRALGTMKTEKLINEHEPTTPAGIASGKSTEGDIYGL